MVHTLRWTGPYVGPRTACGSNVPQIGSSTASTRLGRGLGNCSRTALRSAMPSTNPSWSSSAPRSYILDISVNRADWVFSPLMPDGLNSLRKISSSVLQT